MYISRLTSKLAGIFGSAILISMGSAITMVDVTVAAAKPPAAICEGQAFLQPFVSYKDLNYYTLVSGSEFQQPAEGWELRNGARIVQTTRPDGTTGSVLDMPSGAVALSPTVCVTLRYPTARAWVRNLRGAEGVSISVAYTHTNTALAPKTVGQIHGDHSSWTLSNPINVQPQIAGSVEETREVRFVYTSGGKTSDFQVYGLYVDPRMN